MAFHSLSFHMIWVVLYKICIGILHSKLTVINNVFFSILFVQVFYS